MYLRSLRFIILGIIWFFISFASAQDALQIKKLTTNDGLNFRHVNAIAQDKNGFMWFGTYQGISKYDGNIFKVFNSSKGNPNFIPYEKIYQFQYQKSKNILWYLANGKLFSLDLDKEELINTDLYLNKIKNDILEIRLDLSDNLWLVTDDNDNERPKQYLLKLSGNKLTNIKSLERNGTGFTSIQVTNENHICWATINHGLTLIDQSGSIVDQKKIDGYNWYGENHFFGNSFFSANGKHYYLSKNEGGIEVYDGFKFQRNLLDKSEVLKIGVDDKVGGIWFIGQKELMYLSPKDKITDFTNQIKESHLIGRINKAYVDETNLLWLATDNGLLKIKLQPQNFQKILKSDREGWGRGFRSIFSLKNGKVIAMSESDNKLFYVNTNAKSTAVEFSENHEKLNNARFFVSDTILDKVFTVTDGLLEIDFNDKKINSFDQFAPFVNSTKPNPLIQLDNGKLLAGHKLSKLITIDPKTKKYELVFKDTLNRDYEILRCFEQSKINPEIVWIGTQGDGLLKVNLNGKIEEVYDINSNPALNKNAILCILELDKSILLGTFGGGINILDLQKNTVNIINQEDGFPDDNVVSILKSPQNEIVVSTYNGLCIYNLNTNRYHNYFTEDGLTHNEFNYTSSYYDGKGNYYLGGVNGLNKFNFYDLSQNYYLPSIHLTKYQKYDQDLDTTFTFSKVPEKAINLSPYDINFNLSWSIRDYFNQENYRYYTKMEGFDVNWIYQGSENNINYNKLPAGEYVFKVKGKDINGNISQAELQIPVKVDQIFYKKPWFILSCIILMIGLLYTFYRYKLNQALAIERLRTKISSDLHDDVGSMLTGLAMQTEMLEMQTKSKSEKSKLKKITTLSRQTISHMRDLVWSIDGRRDRMSDLLERMNELAEEMLLPAKITYDIEVNDLNFNKKINLNCKRNLFLIYKEAITNVIKHSNANYVNVTISLQKKTCLFSIKDNGDIEEIPQNSGLGLSNIKMRCSDINAEVKFEIQNGFGIYVVIPNSIL